MGSPCPASKGHLLLPHSRVILSTFHKPLHFAHRPLLTFLRPLPFHPHLSSLSAQVTHACSVGHISNSQGPSDSCSPPQFFPSCSPGPRPYTRPNDQVALPTCPASDITATPYPSWIPSLADSKVSPSPPRGLCHYSHPLTPHYPPLWPPCHHSQQHGATSISQVTQQASASLGISRSFYIPYHPNPRAKLNGPTEP